MRLADLRTAVCDANRSLGRSGLVLYTFGNVSAIDRAADVVAIKPSGVSYEALRPEDIVLVDQDGVVVDGALRPSSDTPTHLALYRRYAAISGITHSHSTHATAWAQAGRPLPCLGTTHADYCHGAVPCTAMISAAQIGGDYEYETGCQIISAMADRDPLACPMVLVAGHGPFTWGRSADESVYHAVILEELARMAALSLALAPDLAPIPQDLIDYHHQRKHGPQARYGQTAAPA